MPLQNHTPNSQEPRKPRQAELDLTNPTRTDTRGVEANDETSYGNAERNRGEQGCATPATTTNQPAQSVERPIPGRDDSNPGTAGAVAASRDTQD